MHALSDFESSLHRSEKGLIKSFNLDLTKLVFFEGKEIKETKIKTSEAAIEKTPKSTADLTPKEQTKKGKVEHSEDRVFNRC